jgi:sigma-B regulation protein RsbU (phosphoserine phosphatase)
MKAQDLSQNQRIARLWKMTQELERSSTPLETLRTIHQGLDETYGIIASLTVSTRGLPKDYYRVVQLQLEGEPLIDISDPAPNEPWPVQSGGVVAAIIGRREPQLIQDVDWSADPFYSETLAGYTSVLAIPFGGDHLPMTWAILLKRPPERFTVMELEEAVLRVALVGALLESQVLAEQLLRANERIDRDARQVGELQRSLLPAAPPQISGLEIAVSYEPSGRAGGDFYDFFPLDQHGNGGVKSGDNGTPPGRWCIIIGDAAGHGLAAAVVMALAQSMLRAHPAGIAGPADLLVHANRQLCRRQIGGFVTAFVGVYEPAARRLTYAAAGHPPPLLKRSSDGAISPLNAVASYPLGIIDEPDIFKEATVQLRRGDTVLLYTDGITEARGAQRELFNQDTLMSAFRDGGDRPSGLIERLRKAVRAHEHGQPAIDDQTLVAARAV